MYIYYISTHTQNQYILKKGIEKYVRIRYVLNINIPLDMQTLKQPEIMNKTIEIYKDYNRNLYVKTGRKDGFMTRLSDGTRHDGTTMGDFLKIMTIVLDK